MTTNPWESPPSFERSGRPVGDRPDAERLHLSDVWAALTTTAVIVLLGAPVGLLWGAVAPRVAVVKVAEGLDLVSPETKAFIGGDGTFLLITVLVGVAVGVAAALIGRRFAPGVVVGVAVGGLLAAWIASKVGHRLGYDEFVALRDHAAVNTSGSAFVKIRAEGVLFGWPVAACLALLTVTAARRPVQSTQQTQSAQQAQSPWTTQTGW